MYFCFTQKHCLFIYMYCFLWPQVKTYLFQENKLVLKVMISLLGVKMITCLYTQRFMIYKCHYLLISQSKKKKKRCWRWDCTVWNAPGVRPTPGVSCIISREDVERGAPPHLGCVDSFASRTGDLGSVVCISAPWCFQKALLQLCSRCKRACRSHGPVVNLGRGPHVASAP